MEAKAKRGKTRFRPDKKLLILDLYEDNNKFRWIFPLVSLLLFIFVVFTVILWETTEKQEPSYIEILMEPAAFQTFGVGANIRHPGIKVVDKLGVINMHTNLECLEQY